MRSDAELKLWIGSLLDNYDGMRQAYGAPGQAKRKLLESYSDMRDWIYEQGDFKKKGGGK